jgi:predicted nucleic acid-binding protein
VRVLRVYADTSVFGGCFDAEFARESQLFFEAVRAGEFAVVISPRTVAELRRAPNQVQRIWASLKEGQVEMIEFSPEIAFLRDAYLTAGILAPAQAGDAEHIAAASVAEVDFLISWNFKHIVHYDKMRGYKAVNLLHGYPEIEIHSPKEVVRINDEEDL